MEKINVAELLKECPSGMELDCAMYDKVILVGVDNDSLFPIKVRRKDGCLFTLTKYGQYCDSDYAKCVIFPKGKTTWGGFQRPFEDGDIVASNDSLFIGIVKYVDENCIYTYCAINKVGNLTQNCPYYFHRFATEEEKEKLFKAIKDNGYKWNAETKTFEKLPKFNVGDRIILKDNPHNIPSIRIKAVTNSQYILENEGFFYISSADEKYILEDKFDINTLKPFESRVLVRDYNNQIWIPTFWGKRLENDSNCNYLTTNGCYKYCIPYEGHEHLIGTTDDCDEFYKTLK